MTVMTVTASLRRRELSWHPDETTRPLSPQAERLGVHFAVRRCYAGDVEPWEASGVCAVFTRPPSGWRPVYTGQPVKKKRCHLSPPQAAEQIRVLLGHGYDPAARDADGHTAVRARVLNRAESRAPRRLRAVWGPPPRLPVRRWSGGDGHDNMVVIVTAGRATGRPQHGPAPPLPLLTSALVSSALLPRCEADLDVDRRFAFLHAPDHGRLGAYLQARPPARDDVAQRDGGGERVTHRVRVTGGSRPSAHACARSV